MKTVVLTLVILMAGAFSEAKAATIISNLFSGTSGGTSSVSATGGLATGNTVSGSLGAGYSGTVYAGPAFSTSTLTINDTATPNELSFTTNALASVAPTFSATGAFSGVYFAPSTTYSFTLTSTSSGLASLLGTLNFDFTANGTDVANTLTGTGLAGGTAINLVGLFGSGNTATVTFTTAANVNTTNPIQFNITGNGLASIGNTSLVLNGASLSTVATPEPSTYGMIIMGGFMLLLVLGRREHHS